MDPLARILVIDNDPSVGDDLVSIFSPLGYEVELVTGSGAELLTNAHTHAKQFRPHVAIIDVRLIDEYTDETSGIKLLQPLSSARCILYSSHLTATIARDARRYGAHEWVNKADEPDFLIQIVQDAAKLTAAQKNTLSVHWPTAWKVDEILAQIFVQESADPMVDIHLLNDLMVQLFSKHHDLYVTTMTGAVVTITATSRARSFVAKIQPDNLEPHVMKVAKVDDINREVDNYHEHIEGRLSGHFHTRLERHATFWDVGAALYSFLGTPLNSIHTFSSYYREQKSAATLEQPLTHFFTEVWRRHYEERTVFQPNTTLYDIYKDEFGLKDKLKINLDHAVYQLFSAVSPPLPDPLEWLRRHYDDNSIYRPSCAIVHGDLHGDNLFVNDRYAWVIDFERTGPSHALRDFAELEIDILTRLINENVPYSSGFAIEFYHCLDQIMSLQAVATPNALINLPISLEMRKAVEIIKLLRQLAQNLVPYREPREYLWALLYDAIFACYMKQANMAQRQRSFLVAAIICDKLSH